MIKDHVVSESADPPKGDSDPTTFIDVLP